MIQINNLCDRIYIYIYIYIYFSAPGRLFLTPKELSPAFPAVVVPLPPRRSGVSTCGDRKWICWREWRWASTYLLPQQSESAAVLRDRKRWRLPGEQTRRFSYLPLRRMSVRPPRLCLLCRPSMRSCWSLPEPAVLPRSSHLGVEIVGEPILGPPLRSLFRLLR